MAVVVAFLFIMLATAFYSMLNGFVLSTLWGWFAVPIFGLPALGIAPAIGIAMIVTWLTYRPPSKDDEEKALLAPGKALLNPVLRALGALLFGWIVTLFL